MNPSDTLTLDFYQKQAALTKVYKGTVYPYLGLASEAGEVAQEMKRALRDDPEGPLTAARHMAIAKELGDVLWYVAAIATDLNVDLSAIAAYNLNKLASRAERQLISGEGGDR